MNRPSSTLVNRRFLFPLNMTRPNCFNHRYAIQAKISFSGGLKYTNQSAYNVITNGNPTKVGGQ
jgi:uncharacterized lipoprotein YbaY